jgi:hypothetical protein
MADGGTPTAPAWLAPFVRALKPFLRDIRRAAVTSDALLTLDDVCELIPGRDGDVRAWVQREVKALSGPTCRLYRWKDVQEARVSPSKQAPLPAPSQAPPGFVYLIAAKKRYKIGYTAQEPRARLRALQTGSPETLSLIGWFRGSADDERALHVRWANLHYRGEWFHAHAGIVEDFVALARGGS